MWEYTFSNVNNLGCKQTDISFWNLIYGWGNQHCCSCVPLGLCAECTAWQTGVTQHHIHWLKVKSRWLNAQQTSETSQSNSAAEMLRNSQRILNNPVWKQQFCQQTAKRWNQSMWCSAVMKPKEAQPVFRVRSKCCPYYYTRWCLTPPRGQVNLI